MSCDIVVRVARALWELDCRRAAEDERRAGRNPPERWADPWHPSGCGVKQQKPYLEEARAVIAAMLAPTNEMIRAGAAALESCRDSDWESDGDSGVVHYDRIRSDAPSIIFRAMIDELLK